MQNFSQIGEVPWPTLTQILQNMPLNTPKASAIMHCSGQFQMVSKKMSFRKQESEMNNTALRQFGVRRKKIEKNLFKIPTGGKLTRWLFKLNLG